MSHFFAYLSRMKFIKFWGLMHNTYPENIQEHCLRVAMIVTTHVRFADWTQVFGDERLTGALLDRLTYRAPILEFVGESFRFRQRLRRDAQKPKG